MPIARFDPEMYDSYLKESATFKLPDKHWTHSASHETTIDEYPHFVLFMALHLGGAFYDDEIKQNIEKINKIPAEELTAPNVMLEDIVKKYDLVPPTRVWD